MLSMGMEWHGNVSDDGLDSVRTRPAVDGMCSMGNIREGKPTGHSIHRQVQEGKLLTCTPTTFGTIAVILRMSSNFFNDERCNEHF